MELHTFSSCCSGNTRSYTTADIYAGTRLGVIMYDNVKLALGHHTTSMQIVFVGAVQQLTG